jgi:protein phosphatase
VHDCWQTEEQVVIMVEDRSHWPLLLEVWQSTPDSHFLYVCYQMAALWTVLEPWGCCRSLLIPSNLRMDADQVLALQRLYFDLPGQAPTLMHLGRLWQDCLQQGNTDELKLLTPTLERLRTEQLQSALELQEVLEVLLEHLDDPESLLASGLEPLDPDPAEGIEQTTLEEEDEDGEDERQQDDEMPTVVLPMRLVGLEDVGRTDVGRQRRHNEDYFCIQSRIEKLDSPSGRTVRAQGLYILCDGMGGHAGGEIASTLAVNTLRRFFEVNWLENSLEVQQRLPSESVIREAIAQANATIFEVNQTNARSGSGRMGTTLVLVLVQDMTVAIAHVGDSRLYRLGRRMGLEQLTVDHEVGQLEILRGVEPQIAYARPDAYQLTQALGPRDSNFIEPGIRFIELFEDSLLLLASDGLTDNELIEKHWQSHLEPLLSSRANLDQGVYDLIELANEHNGHDNISAIVVRLKVRPNLEL